MSVCDLTVKYRSVESSTWPSDSFFAAASGRLSVINYLYIGSLAAGLRLDSLSSLLNSRQGCFVRGNVENIVTIRVDKVQ